MDVDKPPDFQTIVLIGIAAFVVLSLCCVCSGAAILPLLPLRGPVRVRR